MRLSCVIPSFKDPNLVPTINSLLENSELGDQLEIIVTFDGYWPTFEFPNHPQVRYVHLGKNRGMREAINAAVSVSRGEYILRADEHCMFAPGYDKTLVSQFPADNVIMTPKRFFLDVDKWGVMNLPPVTYERLMVRDMGDGAFKFEGRVWGSRDKERSDIDIDETMAMQGSCWIMPHAWWDKVIVNLDSERYGDMLQDSHEMVFKTWKAGGKLMVNKNTWFAHKHVSFPRTHNHPRGSYEKGITNMYEDWIDYYDKEVKLKWNL